MNTLPKPLRPNLWDLLLISVLALLLWSRNIVAIIIGVIAFPLYALLRYLCSSSSWPRSYIPETNEEDQFLVESTDYELRLAVLDSDTHFRRLSNHFFVRCRRDGLLARSLYEYRVDGNKVFCRLL